jgi:hypothetical protein
LTLCETASAISNIAGFYHKYYINANHSSKTSQTVIYKAIGEEIIRKILCANKHVKLSIVFFGNSESHQKRKKYLQF